MKLTQRGWWFYPSVGIVAVVGAGLLITMLLLISFSLGPHFGVSWKRSPPIIQLIERDAATNSEEPETKDNRVLYLVNDLPNLEKALRLSDSIALLAILVAMAAFGIPFITYLFFQREEKILDVRMESKFWELTRRQEEDVDRKFEKSRRSITESVIKYADEKLQELDAKQQGRIGSALSKLTDNLSKLNAYRTLLSLADLTADRYSTEPIDKADPEDPEASEQTDIKKKIDRINERIDRIVEHSANADKVRSALTNLLEEEDKRFEEGVNILGGFIGDEDRLEPGEFVVALKKYLYALYRAGYVDTDAKAEEFRRFVFTKLGRQIDVFLSEQSR